MQIQIITPERVVFEADDASHVLLPAENGEMGVLPGHMPIVATLRVGRIRVDRPGGNERIATSGGFLQVHEDQVTVLADTAERAREIDVPRARARVEWAEEQIRRHRDGADVGAAHGILSRGLNRIRVAGGE